MQTASIQPNIHSDNCIIARTNLNFCPNCGQNLCSRSESIHPTPVTIQEFRHSPEALDRLKPKLYDMLTVVDEMTNDEYGAWVNALPSDEFSEFIGLKEEDFRCGRLEA